MDNVWSRYASPGMIDLFSDRKKYETWRTLWYLLAEQEKALGLDISEEQLTELRDNIGTTDIDRAREIETETHHDVMAHLRHYAEQCPKAAPILHLGATSCYITDNTDVITMLDAAHVIYDKLEKLVDTLADLAFKYKDVETVGRTHFQPAQPTTVGKRIAMWTQDFMMDLRNLDFQIDNVRPLGCKGATGTCDSFLKLLKDEKLVVELDHRICCRIGPCRSCDISGQTYTRKQDFYLLQTLSGIAQSASKMATDIRLLSGLGEMFEPFGDSQVGSSAMPYKRNPMLCERVCGLSRYVVCSLQNAAITASTQWLERSLDDSSNRRIVIPEMFMATDAVLDTCVEIVSSLQVNRGVISDNLYENICNTATEGILMYCTARGGDRQKLHEKLRKYAIGGTGSFLVDIMNDPDFDMPVEELERIVNSPNCGIASQQVERYTRQIKLRKMYEL